MERSGRRSNQWLILSRCDHHLLCLREPLVLKIHYEEKIISCVLGVFSHCSPRRRVVVHFPAFRMLSYSCSLELTTPGIEAVVDGKKCLLKLGTSSKFFLSLNENGLECVADKTPRGTGRWHDRRGNFYESPTYAVKNLTIGNMVFSK